MSIPEQITESQKANIVSLPYRVGLWVSLSDQTGGIQADDKELVALSNIIDGFAGDVFGSELVQYIMRETLSRRQSWENWAANIGDVPGDCRKAVDVLAEHVEPKEVAAYAARLIEIGEAVALAFREREELDSVVQKSAAYMAYGCLRLRAKVKKRRCPSFGEFLNISADERKALEKLALTLGTVYI